MELKKITEKAHYIPGAVNIGVIILEEGTCALIDSGMDKDTARKILRLLESENLNPIALINTHSHADHCGGNRYLKEQTGLEVYAARIESAMIENPYLEPSYLFSGANPIGDLKNRFLMAKPSDVDVVIEGEKELDIKGQRVYVVLLPGHSPGQIGILFDDVLYCADSIFSKALIEKHRLPFNMDVKNTLKTLEFLKNSDYGFYLPSHAGLMDDISELAQYNIDSVENIKNDMLKLLKEPISSQELLKDICDALGIEIRNPTQYHLLNTSMMAYLSYLKEENMVKSETVQNRFLWSIL